MLITITVVLLLFVCPLQARSKNHFTTLLPIIEEVQVENSIDKNTNDLDVIAPYLWLQTEGPQVAVFLQFDLSTLPESLTPADFKNCTLRLVARDYAFHHKNYDEKYTGGPDVDIVGKLASNDMKQWSESGPIVDLSTIGRSNKKTIALGSGDLLSTAVSKQYDTEDKKFTVRLEALSDKASALLYSSADSMPPSFKPRLVIEYTAEAPGFLETLSWPQHQHNPAHTGQSPWKPFKNPTGFSLEAISSPCINSEEATVQAYPLIYRGNIFVIVKSGASDDTNYLQALDFSGKELWRRGIGPGKVENPPVICRHGIFYVVKHDRISAYDLKQLAQSVAPENKPVAEYPPGGSQDFMLSAYTDLTCGNDGSLFAAVRENELNYVYGFTADLKPFIKSEPFKAEHANISSVTASQNGGQIFAQTPEGAAVIDIIDPVDNPPIKLENEPDKDKPWEIYHVPIAGPEDVMIFSDYSENAKKGNIWSYKNHRRIWNSSDTLLWQPVLGSNGFVYYFQDGTLQRQHSNQKKASKEPETGSNPKPTSNLVMDGADNIFFWAGGNLCGYKPDGTPLFKPIRLESAMKEGKCEENQSKKVGPETNIRLMLSPNGTLWANNDYGKELFAFKPEYDDTNLTLDKDLENNTVYRAAGNITLTQGQSLTENTTIMLQAGKGISLPKNFRVQKGAGMICRIGF